jgi:hypothetical protein
MNSSQIISRILTAQNVEHEVVDAVTINVYGLTAFKLAYLRDGWADFDVWVFVETAECEYVAFVPALT